MACRHAVTCLPCADRALRHSVCVHACSGAPLPDALLPVLATVLASSVGDDAAASVSAITSVLWPQGDADGDGVASAVSAVGSLLPTLASSLPPAAEKTHDTAAEPQCLGAARGTAVAALITASVVLACTRQVIAQQCVDEAVQAASCTPEAVASLPSAASAASGIAGVGHGAEVGSTAVKATGASRGAKVNASKKRERSASPFRACLSSRATGGLASEGDDDHDDTSDDNGDYDSRGASGSGRRTRQRVDDAREGTLLHHPSAITGAVVNSWLPCSR
jgi:hypothetical protein